MSTSTHLPTSPEELSAESHDVAAFVARPLRALGFWTAVVLPFLTVVLLTLGVLTIPLTLAALLLVEPAALVAGRDYGRDDE
ncbi:hypothetical protein [Halospeciosus flavus]|uniref:Sensor histidine kinase n=1 Tax=Halospeciosus flavus TaxID=3032283 RepID=A0ABD5Z602_9EURY|nr:hypothetical protein [Halospeciosus flavus]